MDIKAIIGDIYIETNEDIESALNVISKKEKTLNKYLEGLLEKQSLIEIKMGSLSRSMLTLNTISVDVRKLDTQIRNTAQLSESVSAKVRDVDLARRRASDCQQRVHDLIDLQLCSQGVLTAIQKEDFEKGARHINRFLAMDKQLLQRTADDVQSSVTSVSNAVRTLETAAENLREIIIKRFNDAEQKDDLASVERYFKIFPLLNCHREGIEKFGKYICGKLHIKSKKDLRNCVDIARSENRLHVAYADALTILLENFARVIEVNHPIIESCYGTGYLLQLVIVLQHECDVEVKNLLVEFNKFRRISNFTQEVNEIDRPVVGGTIHSHNRKPSGGTIDKNLVKTIDAITAEITTMHSRAELYFRFMRRRVMADIENSKLNIDDQKYNLEKLDKTINNCDLKRQMQELLGTYLRFERYIMAESVSKAILLDKYEAGQQCSSMVDDVFFILRKSILRSLMTQSISGTCAVVNNAASFLDGNFLNALKTHLKNGYASGYIDLAQAYTAIQSSLQHGKLQSSEISEKARQNFIVQLNNADMSTEYIETLYQTVEQEINGLLPNISKTEHNILDTCINELKTVHDALKACVDFGMEQLRSSALKPRISPWINQFLTYNHCLTEEEFATYQAGETFIQFLIMQIDGLLNSFKTSLSSRNYEALVIILAAEVTTRFESIIKKTTYNQLGGLVLDQEVRNLSNYLTNATSWSVRDKMTRLVQISTLLNLEKVSEIEEYWNPIKQNESTPWCLTNSEVKTILTLRTDFRMEDIKRIQL